MKFQILFKLFLASLFVAGSTSLYVFAWLTNVEELVPVARLTLSYIVSVISICFVISWWLEKSFFKILMEYDNSLHSITHDLRNPVSAIMGFLDYMLKGVPGPINPVQKKMLLSMHRASLRLLLMINNMLDVAKVEAEQMKLELAPLSLKEIACNVISIMEGMGESKHITFSVEGTEGNLNGDRILLDRTISNLVSNSIKYCGDNGIVKIKVWDDLKNAYISVEDNGEGIPKDKQKTVFEKYRQAGQKRSGTGLGLNLCRYVAQLHKGKIMLSSEPGKGSVFTVCIPKSLKLNSESKNVVKPLFEFAKNLFGKTGSQLKDKH